MGLHLPDFVRVTIDGTDRTAYVISYSRHSSLCSFSDTFTLEMSFEIPAIPDPYDTIVIRELYDGENEKVLGGYIIDVIQDFERGTYVVNGQDKTLLLDDYFIHTQNFANNETVGYWMNWYAGLVGLTIQYDSSVSQFFVEEGTPMGMQTASEGISMLERLAAVYIKYDAEIDKLRVFRINTSEPVISITNDETTTFSRELGTKDTRNVVKVYGGYQYNIFKGTSTQVFAKARTDIDALIVDKIAVMANPHIKRTTIAQIVASRILSIVDSVDDIVIVETAGFYPFVDVGDYASIDVGSGNHDYASDREITDIQTSVGTAGAITIFIVGEKCPRVSIMPPLSVVYATAQNGGVLVSWDGGDSFDPFNKGIVSLTSEVASGIDGYSIAANKHGQLMAIVGSGVWRRTGKYGSWSQVTTLPDPSDDEGEFQLGITNLDLIKIEKESSAYGRFHLLTRATSSGTGLIPPGQERWWVYWTPDHGYNWDSMQLYVPGSGNPVGSPSGLPIGLVNGVGITHPQMQALATVSGAITWNVVAHDIEGGQGGDITVLVQGEPKAFIPDDTVAAETFYFSYCTYATAWSFRAGIWFMDGSDPYQGTNRSNWSFAREILTDFSLMRNLGTRIGNTGIFSIPNSRGIAYAIAEKSVPLGNLAVGRTTSYRTTYGYQDVPEWDHVVSADTSIPVLDSFGLQSYSVLVDYSSLNGDDKVRFCVIGAGLDGNSGGGDSYPSNSNIEVHCYFFEDDISVAASGTSCTVTNDTRLIGIDSYAGSPLSYTGEGTYGWTEQQDDTGSPTPRGWASQEPMGQGAQPNCVTTNLTGTNYGYYAVMVRDTGHWHADSRDAGWPGVQHPRDWGEYGAVGVYIVKVNLTDMEIDDISLWQGFAPDYHDTIAADQPDRDDDIDDWATGTSLRAMMTQPDLAFFQTRKGTGNANVIAHYLTYPGLGRTQYDNWHTFLEHVGQTATPVGEWAGARKVPYYSATPVGYASKGRELVVGSGYTGTSDSRVLYDNYAEGTVDAPTMPSGMLSRYRSHPNFGHCVTERRAVAAGVQNPLLFDHVFMMKAQRASPDTFVAQGNTSRYSDPYAQTSYGLAYHFDWDFRTKWGSTPHPSGGDYFNWNWLSG